MKTRTLLVTVVLLAPAAHAQFCLRPPSKKPNACEKTGGGKEAANAPPPMSMTGPGLGPESTNPPITPSAGQFDDPVQMDPQTSYYETTDFTVNTSLGPVSFTRRFVSDAKTWDYWGFGDQHTLFKVPKPFGTGRVGTAREGLRWSHNFYAVVARGGATFPKAWPNYGSGTPAATVLLRDIDGEQHRFIDVASGAGWCGLTTNAPSIASRLWRLAGGGYEFYATNGHTQVFTNLLHPSSGSDRYFLTEERLPSGKPLYRISYAQPKTSANAPLTCDDYVTGGPGYIDKITLTPDPVSGAHAGELQFSYVRLARPNASGEFDCVISEIKLVRPGGATTQLAKYDYNLNLAGDITAFTDMSVNSIRERYGYGAEPPTKFEVLRGDPLNGFTAFTHNTDSSYVVTSTSGGGSPGTILPTWKAVNAPTSCVANTCCKTTRELNVTGTFATVSVGDGVSAPTTATRSYDYLWGEEEIDEGSFLYRRNDGFGVGGAGSGGATEWLLTSLDGGGLVTSNSQGNEPKSCSGRYGWPGVIWATKDKRGGYRITEHERVAAPGGNGAVGIDPMLQLANIRRGAVSRGDVFKCRNGSPPVATDNCPVVYQELERTNFEYNYPNSMSGGWGQQRLFRVTQPSAHDGVGGGGGMGTTTTERAYDEPTSRVTKTVKEGKTHLLNGTVETRYRATFYKTSRTCPSPVASDPLNRILRIEGPCWLDNAADNACSTTKNASWPVTEFSYYPLGTGDTNAGRLESVISFPTPTSTCAQTLVTTYPSYDWSGLPLEVRDPNYAAGNTQARTLFTYENGRPKQMMTTVAGVNHYTTWTYENGLLTSIGLPNTAGTAASTSYIVYCYRTGGTGSCTGAWNRNLQWVAKSGSINGNGWSEQVRYTYASHDLSLRTAEFYSAGDTNPRFVQKVENDGQYRPTWDAVGTAGSFPVKRKFDGNDNLEALGPAYNAPGAFCGTNPYACAWMKYDRADRLTQLDVYPDRLSQTGGSRTCMQYDAQGNVRRVAAGCASTAYSDTTCPTNLTLNGAESDMLYVNWSTRWSQTNSSCTAAVLDYEVDDFGNTTSVTFPWSPVAANGLTRYEYDANGHALKKQTEQMRAEGTWLSYTYDGLGRLTGATANGPTNYTLYTLGYDGTTAPEVNCRAFGMTAGATASNPKGRLTRRYDAFGLTWYHYDEEGHVTQEDRLRFAYVGSPTGCQGSLPEDRNPFTQYTYNPVGGVATIRYPHGRPVEYVYDTASFRPTAIRYSKWTSLLGGSWSTPANIISNIVWEPFGGLRGYRMESDLATDQWVEYYRGVSLNSNPPGYTLGANCSAMTAPGSTASDATGRLKGVFVSTNVNVGGTPDYGAPNGLAFKQYYKWDADMLVAQYTCHQNAGKVVTEGFSYNNALQLTAATSDAAPTTGETFTYDLRGNRTSVAHGTPSCTTKQDSMTASGGLANQLDLLYLSKWGTNNGTACSTTSVGRYDYGYDRDGRRASVATSGNTYVVQTSSQQSYYGAGLDSVFHFATLSGGSFMGGTYSYFYDAFGRRIGKSTPWSTKDEMFYDLGHQMLSDRGVASMTPFPAPDLVEDDYIWLGGRPVVIVRNRFSPSTGARYPDAYEVCRRNDQDSVCSAHFPVTDYLGKPVAMLAAQGSVPGGTAGIGRYQAYGMQNRREARYANNHGSINSGAVPIMTVSEEMPSNFDANVRALLHRVDYVSGGTASLKWNGVTQSLAGSNQGHIWTGPQYKSVTGWPLTYTDTNGSSYGVDVEAYDFKMKQQWVWWFWTPLRFPGQYFDEETELHENWNRNYDPQTGRYLQPEPLLSVRGFSARAALSGFGTPVFAYSLNNPVRRADRTGLVAGVDDLSYLAAAGVALAVYFMMQHVNGAQAQPMIDFFPDMVKRWRDLVKNSNSSNPYRGPPGGCNTNPGSGQIRGYGADGRPSFDVDYDHSHDGMQPHIHEWENGVRYPGKSIDRDPSGPSDSIDRWENEGGAQESHE